MKKVLSILMIIAVMLPSLTKIGILIDFKLNQDLIAEVLCINKDKPITTCNGKCYLSKQLKKAEEQQEKQAPPNKKERVEIVYYCYENIINSLCFTDNLISNLNPAWVDEFYTSSFIPDIFNPPKLNLIQSI